MMSSENMVKPDNQVMHIHMLIEAFLVEYNQKILNPLGLQMESTLKDLDVQPEDMGLIIHRIHIHCDIIPAPTAVVHSPEDLVIFPSYEYSNGNLLVDVEPLSQSPDSAGM